MLLEALPPPGLAAAVACSWVHRVAGPTEAVHRTAASGAVEIVHRQGGPVEVRGPGTASREDHLPVGATMVGVRLRPEAALAVLGVPPAELADTIVDAGELWGPRWRHLGSELGERTVEGARQGLEQAVAHRLLSGPSVDALVGQLAVLLAANPAPPVRAAAAALHISERQLHRRCVAVAGLGPKELQRILRFQRFLALAARSPRRSGVLSELAVGAGYADQAHLSQESRRLAGVTPGALLRAAVRRCHGHHDHRATHHQLLGGPGALER